MGITLYSDGSAIYLSSKDIEIITQNIQVYLHEIQNWEDI